jgi:hypothetical protein
VFEAGAEGAIGHGLAAIDVGTHRGVGDRDWALQKACRLRCEVESCNQGQFADPRIC